MKGQLVREVPALGDADRVDLADQVGDRGVGRGQLLREALAAVHPGDRGVRPLGCHEVDPVTRDRCERVVADLRAGDDGQPFVEQVHEGPGDPGLRLPPLAEQDQVVARQQGVLELRQDRLVEARATPSMRGCRRPPVARRFAAALRERGPTSTLTPRDRRESWAGRRVADLRDIDPAHAIRAYAPTTAAVFLVNR